MSPRDVKILEGLEGFPRGRAVLNSAVERFAEYEAAGYVVLHAARVGPLGIPDDECFWVCMTEAGRTAIAKSPAP